MGLMVNPEIQFWEKFKTIQMFVIWLDDRKQTHLIERSNLTLELQFIFKLEHAHRPERQTLRTSTLVSRGRVKKVSKKT